MAKKTDKESLPTTSGKVKGDRGVAKTKKTEVTEKKGKRMVQRQPLTRTNKPIVLPDDYTLLKQPTIVTLMRSDLSLTALRIILALIEKLQGPMEEVLKKVAPEQLTLFQDSKESDYIYIQIPTKDFGFSSDRYGELKQSLIKIATIPVELDTKDPLTGDDSTLIKGMFEAIIPKDRYKRYITLKIDKTTATNLVSVDKGFTKFIKEIAYNATNKYTVRIYMLISNYKDLGGYKMKYKDFRELLQLGTKYKDYKDLYKRVIRPAYEELHENADCWFELEETYESGSKDPVWLNFKIIRGVLSPKEKEAFALRKKNIEGLLFNHFKFSAKEMEEILKAVTPDNQANLTDRIVQIKLYITDHKGTIADPHKYALAAIRDALNQLTPYEEIKE